MSTDHKSSYASNQRYALLKKDRDFWKKVAEGKMKHIRDDGFYTGVLAAVGVVAILGFPLLWLIA